MSSPANLRSRSVLPELKSSISRYAGEAQESLDRADQEIHRTLEWLRERQNYWNNQTQPRLQRLGQAKAGLDKCEAVASRHGRADCSGPARELASAQAALREAEEALNLLRSETQRVTQAVEHYQAQARQYKTLLTDRVPHALARLEQRSAAVETYVAFSKTDQRGPSAIGTGAGKDGQGSQAVSLTKQRQRNEAAAKAAQDIAEENIPFAMLLNEEIRVPGSISSSPDNALLVSQATVFDAAVVGAAAGGWLWNHLRSDR